MKLHCQVNINYLYSNKVGIWKFSDGSHWIFQETLDRRYKSLTAVYWCQTRATDNAIYRCGVGCIDGDDSPSKQRKIFGIYSDIPSKLPEINIQLIFAGASNNNSSSPLSTDLVCFRIVDNGHMEMLDEQDTVVGTFLKYDELEETLLTCQIPLNPTQVTSRLSKPYFSQGAGITGVWTNNHRNYFFNQCGHYLFAIATAENIRVSKKKDDRWSIPDLHIGFGKINALGQIFSLWSNQGLMRRETYSQIIDKDVIKCNDVHYWLRVTGPTHLLRFPG
jgi:hypothetical protein